jgi:hypothetical protein
VHAGHYGLGNYVRVDGRGVPGYHGYFSTRQDCSCQAERYDNWNDDARDDAHDSSITFPEVSGQVAPPARPNAAHLGHVRLLPSQGDSMPLEGQFWQIEIRAAIPII